MIVNKEAVPNGAWVGTNRFYAVMNEYLNGFLFCAGCSERVSYICQVVVLFCQVIVGYLRFRNTGTEDIYFASM